MFAVSQFILKGGKQIFLEELKIPQIRFHQGEYFLSVSFWVALSYHDFLILTYSVTNVKGKYYFLSQILFTAYFPNLMGLLFICLHFGMLFMFQVMPFEMP